MSLSRADFTLEPATIQLKDGRSIKLRRLSAYERMDYIGACGESGKANADKTQRERLNAATALAGDLVALCLLGDDGQPIFASGDEAARGMDPDIFDEVGEAAAKLNRIGSGNDPNA